MKNVIFYLLITLCSSWSFAHEYELLINFNNNSNNLPVKVYQFNGTSWVLHTQNQTKSNFYFSGIYYNLGINISSPITPQIGLLDLIAFHNVTEDYLKVQIGTNWFHLYVGGSDGSGSMDSYFSINNSIITPIDVDPSWTGSLLPGSAPINPIANFYIEGPSSLKLKQSGTFFVTFDGGSGSYSYQWSQKMDGSSSYVNGATSQSTSYIMKVTGFTVKCIITDIITSQVISTTQHVSYDNGSALKSMELSNMDVETSYQKNTEISVYPNPFNPSTTINVNLEEKGLLNLNIYDVLGKKVYSIEKVNVNKGLNSFIWNGKSQVGNSVASGIYLLNIVGVLDNGEKINKINKLYLTK